MSSATRNPPPVLYSDTLPLASDQDEPLMSTPTSPLRSRSLRDARDVRALGDQDGVEAGVPRPVKPLTRTWLVREHTDADAAGQGGGADRRAASGLWRRSPRRCWPIRLSGLADDDLGVVDTPADHDGAAGAGGRDGLR